MSFSEDSYYEHQFSRMTLQSETVKEIEFESCTFDRCSFIECSFIDCRFIECAFRQCVISAPLITNGSFTDLSFTDSKAIGIDWTKARALRALRFERTAVDYSNFGFLKLPGMELQECSAKDADFTEADLTGGNFQGTDFTGSIFLRTNLTKANFRKAYNYRIDFRANTITAAAFSLPEAASLLTSLDIILE